MLPDKKFFSVCAMMLNAKNKINFKKATGYLRAHSGRAAEANVTQAVKVAQYVAARFASKMEDNRPLCYKKMLPLKKFCNKPKDRSAVLTNLISEVCGNPIKFSDTCKLPLKFFAVPSFNEQVRSEHLWSDRNDEDKKFLFVVLKRFSARNAATAAHNAIFRSVCHDSWQKTGSSRVPATSDYMSSY